MKQGLLISSLVLSLSSFAQTTHVIENESVSTEIQSVQSPPVTVNQEVIQNKQSLDVKRIERPRISEKKEIKPTEKKVPIKQ